MKKCRIVRSFFLVLSVILLLSACNGNGGSSHSDGAVYNPGGGSSSGSGDAGSIDGSVTAQDLWILSNAGDVERIVELFQTSSTGGETCTVVIFASDLGLPADGSVTLTITGPGINYTKDATADTDGNVRFEVPLLETKTTVTVELIVKDANGTALYTGSEEQEVDSEGNLHVTLIRQGVPQPGYTVSFNIGTGDGTAPADQTVASGAKATKPADPTKTGAAFGGWYTGTVDASGKLTLAATAYDFDNTTVTADLTLYAKWLYTNFTGTVEEFLAAEFATTSSRKNITITDASDANIAQILAHFRNDLSSLSFNLTLQETNPGDLTEIPANAFNYGSYVYLYTITMPASVKKIGYKAFYCCSYLSITFPAGLEEIGDQAINAQHISSISLAGTNIQKIGEKAFFNIGMSGIGVSDMTIPATVTEICSNSFLSNKTINITFSGTNSWTKKQGNSVVATGVTLSASDVKQSSSPVYHYTRP